MSGAKCRSREVERGVARSDHHDRVVDFVSVLEEPDLNLGVPFVAPISSRDPQQPVGPHQ